MTDLTPELAEQSKRMRRAFFVALAITALLWDIKITEWLFGFHVIGLGVYPRELSGLLGVLFAPLIHGSFEHLIANTPATLALITVLLYSYAKSARLVLPVIYFGSGILVWLFAREAHHIGASGLTFGLMFFIFVVGILRRDRQSVGWSLIVFFMYGGMIGGLLPADSSISYESHVAGAFLGIILAFILRNKDPMLPRKIYSWELEEEVDDDWEYEADEGDIEIVTSNKQRYLH